MMLHQITDEAGAHRRRKRVGRGESSGMGRTSGRGNKGCQSRAGYKSRRLAEGGQMPLFRRLPKRGFNNFNFRTSYEVVNLADLERGFDNGAKIDPAALRAAGLVRGDGSELVKVLGTGTLTKKLSITAHGFSAAARAAIEKAGGAVTTIPQRDSAAAAKAKRSSRVEKPAKKPAADAST